MLHLSCKNSRLSWKGTIENLKGSLFSCKVFFRRNKRHFSISYISLKSQNSCILNWERSHSFNIKSRSLKTIFELYWLHYSTKNLQETNSIDDWLQIHCYSIQTTKFFSPFPFSFLSFFKNYLLKISQNSNL